jgi:drug/metabolite transporter (DMT)-like permease
MSSARPGYGLGVFWSLASAVLWSSTFVVARYLLEGDRADPLTLSFLRFAIGSAALLGLGWRTQAAALRRVRLADAPALAGLALFGMVGMSGLLFWGQRSTTAINASLIMQVCPILILLGGAALGERIRPRQALGIPLSFLGCLMVVEILGPKGVRFDAGHLAGDLLVLGSAGCWAVYTLGGKSVVARLGGYAASTLAMACGALEFGVIILMARGPLTWPTDTGAWTAVLYMALLPTAVAFYAWYEAMSRIELALLNVMQYLTPVFTILLAVLLLGERVSWGQGAGIALVLAGVVITGSGRR